MGNHGLNEPEPPVVISTTSLPVDTNIPNPIFDEKSVKPTLADAQKKKEDEIIAQIRKQLYQVLGQKRKQSKLSGPKHQGNQNKGDLDEEVTKSGNKPRITNNDLAAILSNIGISTPAPKIVNKNAVGNKNGKNFPKGDKRKKK